MGEFPIGPSVGGRPPSINPLAEKKGDLPIHMPASTHRDTGEQQTDQKTTNNGIKVLTKKEEEEVASYEATGTDNGLFWEIRKNLPLSPRSTDPYRETSAQASASSAPDKQRGTSEEDNPFTQPLDQLPAQTMNQRSNLSNDPNSSKTVDALDPKSSKQTSAPPNAAPRRKRWGGLSSFGGEKKRFVQKQSSSWGTWLAKYFSFFFSASSRKRS